MTPMTLRLAAVVAPAMVLIAACSGTSAQPAEAPSQAASAIPSPSTRGSEPPSEPAGEPAGEPVSGSDVPGHVHNLGYDGATLLLGTHEGLWAQVPGQSPVQISEKAFDVMGFATAGNRWLASGHPGADEDGPHDLGLLESTDQGVTWEPVSLSGEVDFHRLVTAGERIYGISSADNALLRSDDAGGTWTTLGTAPLYDIAVDPADPDTLLATTADGPVRSTDAGATFAPVLAPSLIALIAWTGDQLVGVDTDGLVLTSTDAGDSWQRPGRLPTQPMALAADGSRIAALVDGTVFESSDGGSTFTERISGIEGH